MPGALPAVTVPAVASPRSSPSGSAKTGRSRASASAVESRRGFSSSAMTVSRPFASRIVTGASLRGEPAGVHRGDRLLVARERERVLVLAAHVVADRDALGVRAHVAVLDGAPQAVADGRVHDLGVAQAVAEAGAGQQVRRAVHRLHAAGDGELGVAGPDLRGGQHDRLQAGAADAVDGRGGRRVGESGAQDRLASGRLAGTALEDLAHEHVVEGGRRPARARPARRRPGWRCRRARRPGRPPVPRRTCRSACARH